MSATLLTESELERDRRLVRLHQSGDTNAFAQLYELHFGRLVRFCQRKVRDPHLAEELAQESFLKAYRSLATFDGGLRFYPWLTVIATRLVIDHHRRSGRVRPESEIDLGSVDDAQDDLVRQVEHDHVRLALDRVRVRHREVLRLRDWEDLSYEDIARRLGTSPTIVQSLLHRARIAVRREYLALSESAALLPIVGPALAFLHRLRVRAARITAWLPDPAGLSAPLAAAVIAVGSVLGGGSGAAVQKPAPLPEAVPAVLPLTEPAPLPPVSPPRAEAATDSGPPPSITQDPPPEPVAKVWLGPDGAAHARQEGQAMPARLDAGAAFLALDPPAAVQDTVDAAKAAADPIRSVLGGR